MRREGWTFQVSRNKLLAAAVAKNQYHTARRDHWAAEQSVVENQINDTAVKTIRREHTGGAHIDVGVDETLSRRLNECARKIDSHYASMIEFERWVTTLEGDPQGLARELDIDDMIFFGIGG